MDTPEAGRVGDRFEQRIGALGFDAAVVPWVRDRVNAFMTAMLRDFGLDRARLGERARLELLAAETRCAACREVGRCRRFLAGAADDTPQAFCPNARLFRELTRPRRFPRRPRARV